MDAAIGRLFLQGVSTRRLRDIAFGEDSLGGLPRKHDPIVDGRRHRLRYIVCARFRQ
ncbi:MAG: hypothetical protein ACE5IA_06975 [Dehalococcoidia bacterium]